MAAGHERVSSNEPMNSLFCRHNRFTAECPICSKGTVLGQREAPERAKPSPGRTRSAPRKAASPATTRYPHVSIAPVEHEAHIYEVRLEQVPGGLRLGQWRGGELERKAPVLPASALRELFDEARGRGFVEFDLPDRAATAAVDAHATSPGRAGDMQEELRLQQLGDGFVQIARWIFWPGAGVGWERQEAPVMLPGKRFEQLFSDAATKALI